MVRALLAGTAAAVLQQDLVKRRNASRVLARKFESIKRGMKEQAERDNLRPTVVDQWHDVVSVESCLDPEIDVSSRGCTSHQYSHACKYA